VKTDIAEIGRRALEGRRLDRPDVLTLTQAAVDKLDDLLYWANRVRRHHFGRCLRLCAIAPGKLGACSEDCKWCAQSAAAPGMTPPRRSTTGEIIAAARDATTNGAAAMGIVNSGRRPSERDIDEVLAATKRIRSDNPCRLQICASLGELTDAQAARLAAGGVVRYHHNLETSREHFARMVTTHGYDERLETLRAARRAGMSICCGGLFGIGESWEDRAELAMTIRDQVAPDVTPLNFLHPIPGTPLADATPLAPREVLAIIAVFRLVLPTVDIKIAGGRQHNLRDLQSWAFYAGATSCMVGAYLTTAGRNVQDDLRMFADLGMEIVKEFPPA